MGFGKNRFGGARNLVEGAGTKVLPFVYPASQQVSTATHCPLTCTSFQAWFTRGTLSDRLAGPFIILEGNPAARQGGG